jgi:hypothetical protein
MIFLFCGSPAVEIGDPMADIFWIPPVQTVLILAFVDYPGWHELKYRYPISLLVLADVHLQLKAKISTQHCSRDKVEKLQRHPSVAASEYQVAGEYEFSHDPCQPPEFSTD